MFNIVSIVLIKKHFKIKNKVLVAILILVLLSSFRILYLENKFENLYLNINEVQIIGKIVSNKQEKEYTNKYILKVISINNDKKFKNTKLILYTDSKEEYKYGDILSIQGKYKQPDGKRNYKGFDYREYLKQKNIYGIVNSETINKKRFTKIFF